MVKEQEEEKRGGEFRCHILKTAEGCRNLTKTKPFKFDAWDCKRE
jgi:hypothetical protein